MATKAKAADDNVGPIGFLIVFLIAAMAVGGAVGEGGLDLPQGGGASAFEDPCPDGKDPERVVASFHFGKYKLRCGGRFGWRHINEDHRGRPQYGQMHRSSARQRAAQA